MSISALDGYVLKHLTSFLTLNDQSKLAKVDKYFNSLIELPNDYDKIVHFNELRKHYSPLFLLNCVQNYTQALILFNNLPRKEINYFLTQVKCRKTKNIFRKLNYNNYLLEPRHKYLKVR